MSYRAVPIEGGGKAGNYSEVSDAAQRRTDFYNN